MGANDETGQARVREGDRGEPLLRATLPVVVVLDRLRSAYNVGNIFRLADAVRVSRIVTCGYTASPPHPKLAKTARGCDLLVPSEHVEVARDAVMDLRQRGYTVYGVETAEGAVAPWEADMQFPAAFLFGNEALGISTEALACCDRVLSLPALGVKNSINVGNCAAVVLFDALRQWQMTNSEHDDSGTSGI